MSKENLIYLKDSIVDFSGIENLSESERKSILNDILKFKIIKNKFDKTVIYKNGNEVEIDLLDISEVIEVLNSTKSFTTKILIARNALRSSASKLKRMKRYKAGKDEIDHMQSNIEFLEDFIGKFEIPLESTVEDIDLEAEKVRQVDSNSIKNISNELSNAHTIIKRLRKQKINSELNDLEMKNWIDKCRKKNGKVNLRKLGKELGRHHSTVRKWIENRSLIDYAELN